MKDDETTIDTAEFCPECAHWRAEGDRFCPHCGRALNGPATAAPHHNSLLHSAAVACALIVAAGLLFSLVYLVFDLGTLFAAAETISFHFSLYVGTYLCRLSGLSGTALDCYIVLLLIIELLCLFVAVRLFIKGFRRGEKTRSEDATERTGLTAGCTILAVSLLLSYIYFIIAAMYGYIPDTSWTDAYTNEQMYILLANAGTWEELTDRVLYIGVPMMIVAFVYRRDKKGWQYLFGGFGMSRTAVIFILFSSVMFGLAHLNGWGWTKVPDAMIAGLLFGYVYVQYGLYASILMHTANDVMLTVIQNTIGSGTAALLILAVCTLGLLTLIYWVLKPRKDVLNIQQMPWFPAKLEGSVGARWSREQ
ncbi:MAG: CPBP family intramembrane glutamic endopeptidase [Methanomethylophilus sp.]|nr:CPBP family glutamic-type intramembrane protease [Methanomethylophilus sp.]MDD4222375.1 CPBP family glutamic-type intramembrane protease [Methanomethylophilus sp.]MDD4668662.1 CPBP family glutamic-type intramembrane protease [Methanomethylophilus sp.]